MSSSRLLIPQIVPSPQPGDIVRRFRAARERAYRRVTDPRWPLRDRRGSIPMRGGIAMPASGEGHTAAKRAAQEGR